MVLGGSEVGLGEMTSSTNTKKVYTVFSSKRIPHFSNVGCSNVVRLAVVDAPSLKGIYCCLRVK